MVVDFVADEVLGDQAVRNIISQIVDNFLQLLNQWTKSTALVMEKVLSHGQRLQRVLLDYILFGKFGRPQQVVASLSRFLQVDNKFVHNKTFLVNKNVILTKLQC